MEKPFYVGGNEQAKAYQNQQILNNVQAINAGLQQNNIVLQEYINAMNKELQKLKKSKKKKLQSVAIASQMNGAIFLIRFYDNGESVDTLLTTSAVGKWKIFRLKFRKTKQNKEKFAIIFPVKIQRDF